MKAKILGIIPLLFTTIWEDCLQKKHLIPPSSPNSVRGLRSFCDESARCQGCGLSLWLPHHRLSKGSFWWEKKCGIFREHGNMYNYSVYIYIFLHLSVIVSRYVYTLPKFNSSPLKSYLPNWKVVFQPLFFRVGICVYYLYANMRQNNQPSELWIP